MLCRLLTKPFPRILPLAVEVPDLALLNGEDEAIGFGASFGLESPLTEHQYHQETTPNFARLFSAANRSNIQLADGELPPLRPHRQPPSKYNRADYQRGEQNYDPNMPNPTTVVRESPRVGKGVNKRFAEDDGMQKKIPKKTKPSPPEEDKASPNANDPPATTTNGKGMSSDQRLAVLKAKAVVWEKEDSQKIKKVLVQELVQSKKNSYTHEYNSKFWELGQKKTIANFKAYKAKVEPQLEELKELRALIDGNPDQVEQVRALQNDLEFWKMQCDKTKAALVLAHNKNDQLANIAKKAKSEATAARVRAVLPTKSRETIPPLVLASIINTCKTVVWGVVKFIQSPKDLYNCCKLVIAWGIIPQNLIDTKDKKQTFIEEHSEIIKKALFEKRSYVSSEEKKYYVKCWDDNKPTLTVEDLIMCLQRKIVSEKDMAKFQLYWVDYLSKVVGASEWNANVKYYHRICDAKSKQCKKKELPLVNPEDEAFLVLSVENHLQRWRAEYDRKKAGIPVDPEAKNIHDGQFTSTGSGQNQYGGWNAEGLRKYKVYLDMNLAARALPNCSTLEDDCLSKLRDKLGITCVSFEEQNKINGQNKAKRKKGTPENAVPASQQPVVETMRCIEDLESEDELGLDPDDEEDE